MNPKQKNNKNRENHIPGLGRAIPIINHYKRLSFYLGRGAWERFNCPGVRIDNYKYAVAPMIGEAHVRGSISVYFAPKLKKFVRVRADYEEGEIIEVSIAPKEEVLTELREDLDEEENEQDCKKEKRNFTGERRKIEILERMMTK